MGADALAHVRLMTLLNVKAAHPRTEDEDHRTSAKRTRVSMPASRGAPGRAAAEPRGAPAAAAAPSEAAAAPAADIQVVQEDEDDDAGVAQEHDAFHWHFGAEAPALEGVEPGHVVWGAPQRVDVLGGALVSHVERASAAAQPVPRPHARVWGAFTSHYKHSPTRMQRALLPYLGQYMDVWHSRVELHEHAALRAVIAMHAMSHVARTRQRILKDNERLAKAAARAQADDDDELPELRDQGFTRPKVLVLAPFRHSAQLWMDALVACAACEQVEQKSRFQKEFSLPDGTIDKLADPAMAERYPEDHRATFQGNIDDNFKLGIKLTRKTLKLYSAFYDSDVLLASPLGLRLLLEKDRDADYLSSIEVLVVDQMDVMLMQNWEHVRFVLDRLSHIPSQARDTDFSRVKPWYLDGHAPLLRQNILLSAFDAPEFRQLSRSFGNVGGRFRTSALPPDAVPSMSAVAPGVRQTFYKFPCANAQGEADQRLEAFQQKLWPLLDKSAVSASHTMIVVPSYFDFVRLEDSFRRREHAVSWVSLTEYSSNKDISRAREAFFSGKKSFLLLTERFHFYRRYLVRGARTVVFYAPPEHASYYAELINAPLSAKGDTAMDAADLQVLALYSKYDLLRLERIVGAAQARAMVTDGRAHWRFM